MIIRRSSQLTAVGKGKERRQLKQALGGLKDRISHSIKLCTGIPKDSRSEQQQICDTHIWGKTEETGQGFLEGHSIAPLVGTKHPEITACDTAMHWLNVPPSNCICLIDAIPGKHFSCNLRVA